MCSGARRIAKKPLFIRFLRFRGVFSYPVEKYFFKFWSKRGDFKDMESYRLTRSDLSLLDKFMKENDINNKTEAIRECIKRSVARQDTDSLIFDLNNKMNRLIHNQYLTKKLLEQLFANMKFTKNSDINLSESLDEFNDKFNKYGSKFLG